MAEPIHFASQETIIKSKEQRDSGSFRPFVKMTLRQREGIIIGKKDMGTKNLMNYPEVFADIGNVNLFSGKVVLHPEELEPLPTDLIGKPGGKRLIENRLDSRMRYRKGGTEIAILCAENQSDICNAMPVRDMGYQYANYLDQIKHFQKETEGKKAFTKWLPDGEKLKPIITFVLNYSGNKWESPLSLKEMLDIPEEQKNLWEPWITDHPIHVIDLAEQDEETRGKYHSDFRHIVDYLACKGDIQKLQEFRQDETRIVEHPEEFLDLLDAFAGTKTYKAVKETLEKQRKEGGPEKMCVLYDMVFGEGRQEGREEGRREGREEEAVTNARMLFKNGADFELVATSISILPREELEKIYEEVVGR